MILIILILTSLLFSHSVFAQEFSLYADNPVLKKDSQSVGVFQPNILFKNNVYTAWFADSDGNKASIATMKSANGIDWYEKKTLTLSSRYSVHDPSILEVNDGYKLYFASSDYGDISIWESDSSDGVIYQVGSERQILAAEGGWEGSSLSCPSVIQDGSMRYMVYAGNGGGWAIGLATSSDGTRWNKCENNPIIAEGSGPQILKFNNAFYLYYQSPTGLQVLKADQLAGCDTVWNDGHSITPPFGDPAPVVVGDEIWLYGTYGTLDGPGIGLAATVNIPRPNYPIILIPGMFASWNASALLHNSSVPFDSWTLNSGVSEYDALITTLENRRQTLYVFPYDWRNTITDTTSNLDLFIKKNVWNSSRYQPIQIVGHSLGGLVARVYADQHPLSPIKQIVTSGSPLLGTVQSYKPINGGELDRENSLMWVAEKIVLFLNKSALQSDKETFATKFPVLADLIPSFPFLKNSAGALIKSAIPNLLLRVFPIDHSPLIPQIFIGGSGIQTLGGYILGARTAADRVFDTYTEGHPVSEWKDDGDGVSLLSSTLNQVTPPPIANHGEMIYARDQIKKILSYLNIEVMDSDIPAGKPTTIFPAIFSFIQSPATMQIVYEGVDYENVEDKIHIQNAENGLYTLSVTGTASGTYTVHVWLIGSSEDKWFSFSNNITAGAKDEYVISFDGVVGGSVQKKSNPTPTPTAIPTHTPSPTSITKPRPTHKPKQTHKPRPTKSPDKNNGNLNLGQLLQLILSYFSKRSIK